MVVVVVCVCVGGGGGGSSGVYLFCVSVNRKVTHFLTHINVNCCLDLFTSNGPVKGARVIFGYFQIYMYNAITTCSLY